MIFNVYLYRRHNAAFYGSELVTWLVEYGLAQSRQEGAKLGRHLLRGRVVRNWFLNTVFATICRRRQNFVVKDGQKVD